jgi:hypothetical protein
MDAGRYLELADQLFDEMNAQPLTERRLIHRDRLTEIINALRAAAHTLRKKGDT